MEREIKLKDVIAEEIAVGAVITRIEQQISKFDRNDSKVLMRFFRSAGNPDLYGVKRSDELVVGRVLIEFWEQQFIKRNGFIVSDNLTMEVSNGSRLEGLFGDVSQLSYEIDAANPWRTMEIISKYIERALQETSE